MLDGKDSYATIPAQNLQRAKSFYEEKLGLTPDEERADGLRYQSANGGFLVFESSGEPSGTHTQLGWDVEDVAAAVAALRERGVVFEEYDMPGFKTVDGIAELPDGKGAWFKDSEGNLLAIGEMSAE